jgi:hypothetical protein
MIAVIIPVIYLEATQATYTVQAEVNKFPYCLFPEVVCVYLFWTTAVH